MVHYLDENPNDPFLIEQLLPLKFQPVGNLTMVLLKRFFSV